jgi:hypothetical protein
MQDVQIKRDVVLSAVSTWTGSWSIDSQREVLKRLGKKDSVASLDIYKFFEPDHWLRVLHANGNSNIVKCVRDMPDDTDWLGFGNDFAAMRKTDIIISDKKYKAALREVA